jgi:hypothetical protein
MANPVIHPLLLVCFLPGGQVAKPPKISEFTFPVTDQLRPTFPARFTSNISFGMWCVGTFADELFDPTLGGSVYVRSDAIPTVNWLRSRLDVPRAAHAISGGAPVLASRVSGLAPSVVEAYLVDTSPDRTKLLGGSLAGIVSAERWLVDASGQTGTNVGLDRPLCLFAAALLTPRRPWRRRLLEEASSCPEGANSGIGLAAIAQECRDLIAARHSVSALALVRSALPRYRRLRGTANYVNLTRFSTTGDRSFTETWLPNH